MLKIADPRSDHDPKFYLDAIAREGARRMLVAALEAEVTDYLDKNQQRDQDGNNFAVRNGKANTRRVTLGAGTVEVRAPRVNDKRIDDAGVRHRFSSQILPPYMRRSPKVAEVLPVLYLRGLSTGDFKEALPVLLGEDASGLSSTTIARLTNEWEKEYHAFIRRDLSDRDFVYVWVDGIHFNVRLEDDRLCTLVVLGVRPDSTKELIAVSDGYRERKESWSSLLRDLKRRGMQAPVVAVGDGALGFWSAVRNQSRTNRTGLLRIDEHGRSTWAKRYGPVRTTIITYAEPSLLACSGSSTTIPFPTAAHAWEECREVIRSFWPLRQILGACWLRPWATARASKTSSPTWWPSST